MQLHLHVNFTHMNIAQAPNQQVLRYLKRANRNAPDIAAHDSVPNPYYHCGCHPDIVARVWDQIGAAMPAECRCLVTGIPALGITYNYSATADDGKITSMISSGTTVNYSYDTLGRLATAATSGPEWGLSYLYDGFGNRLQQNATKGCAPASNLFVDPSTNRVSSYPWAYDANGNATNVPGVGAITFDWANRVTAAGSETYGYDPGNKRLWKNDKLTLWGGHGERVGTYELAFNQDYNGNGGYSYKLKFKMVSTDRYFAGRKLQYEDRLGSKDPWTGYYPYGEPISATANPADKFATYHRDATGLDYADQRYYHSASGRFVSMDPHEAGVVQLPGSWNRFQYAHGDPVQYSDPSGLDICIWNRGTSTLHCIPDFSILLAMGPSAGSSTKHLDQPEAPNCEANPRAAGCPGSDRPPDIIRDNLVDFFLDVNAAVNDGVLTNCQGFAQFMGQGMAAGFSAREVLTVMLPTQMGGRGFGLATGTTPGGGWAPGTTDPTNKISQSTHAAYWFAFGVSNASASDPDAFAAALVAGAFAAEFHDAWLRNFSARFQPGRKTRVIPDFS